MNRLTAIAFALAFSTSAFAQEAPRSPDASGTELRATPLRNRVEVFASPRLAGRPVGYLDADAEVEVSGRTADGRGVQLIVSRRGGERVKVFGRARDFRFRRVEAEREIERLPVVDVGPGAEPERAHEREDEAVEPEANEESHARRRDRCRLAKPWGFGASFGGYSAGGDTTATVSGDIRYAWCTWTETVLGLDLGFGSDFLVGARAGQRFYATFDSFRPFVHAGYRIFDLSRSESSALELGGGFQIAYGGGSYFEIQVLYLWNTLFNKTNGANAWVFGGGSGIRF